MISNLLMVAAGGAIGASGRYLTGIAMMRLMGPGFPWATLTVNILGSFLMGVLVVTLGALSATRLQPLLAVGLLGGFTTFSSFSLDAVTLWERGAQGTAMAYVGASVVLSLVAICAGLFFARSFIA